MLLLEALVAKAARRLGPKTFGVATEPVGATGAKTHMSDEDELKKEYIKAILAVVEEDKKAVLLYVVFDLAVVSLTLSEKIFHSPDIKSPFVALGLCLLLAAAAFFFNYFRKMHLATFSIVDCLLELRTECAKGIPKEVWAKHREGYVAAYVLQAAGLVVLLTTYVAPK